MKHSSRPTSIKDILMMMRTLWAALCVCFGGGGRRKSRFMPRVLYCNSTFTYVMHPPTDHQKRLLPRYLYESSCRVLCLQSNLILYYFYGCKVKGTGSDSSCPIRINSTRTAVAYRQALLDSTVSVQPWTG